MGLVYPGFGECHQRWKKGWFWVEMEICWFFLRFFKRFCFMDWCQLDMQIWYRPAFAENASGSTTTCRSSDFWMCLLVGDDTILEGLHMSLQSSRNSPTVATKLVMSPHPYFHLHDSCHPFFFTKQEASRENIERKMCLHGVGELLAWMDILTQMSHWQ